MKLFKLALLATILTTPLFSNEIEERVPVGQREMSRQEHLEFKEARALYEEGKKAKALKAATYYTSHQGAYHRPVVVSLLGDTVELEDGSVWAVDPNDRRNTLDWMTGDVILILPNHTWLSSYDYRLVNTNTGANVKVNPILSPIYNGLYTHWIIAIDYINNEICLEDGSVWKISPWDSSYMNKWMVQDTVMIGMNDWFTSCKNYPNMIINVPVNNYAVGICIF